MRAWRVLVLTAMLLPLLGQWNTVRATAASPRFEATPCATFRLPPANGRAVTCGYVTVPESHAAPNGATIRLAVVRFPRERATENPPLVYLAGGPGGGAIGTSYTGSRAAGFALDRDYLAFDQRGTGYSQPNLECPEVRDGAVTDLLLTVSDGERTERRFAAVAACRARLQAGGVDLAAYTSTESAADINDIRVALGYDKIDLLSVSYGTRLALTAMRDFPQMLRSVVLDSIVALQDDSVIRSAYGFNRALNLLFSDCATTGCNAFFPSLRADFSTVVARLNAAPVTITVGKTMRTVNGTRFLSLLQESLYSRSYIEVIPALITQMRDGNMQLLRAFYDGLSGESPFSEGMAYSVRCAEYAPFATPEGVQAAGAELLPEVRDGYLPSVLSIFGVCSRWAARPADPRDHSPVVSDVPTLLLESINDPITPPEFGDRAAMTLSRSVVVRTPGIGHSVIGNGGTCGTALVMAFLANPTAAPDTGCTASLGVMFRSR